MIIAIAAFKAPAAAAAKPVLSIESIGVSLATDQVVALLLVGLLLSAALIGAVILAAPEPEDQP
jgi:NADH:ubiquinone oxidoreductase subunit 6 (subunit J)